MEFFNEAALRGTPRPKGSSYQQLVWEMANKRGIFEEASSRGGSNEPVYVPPWRRTMGEVYGKETVAAMKKPPEEYERRATRFAREEHERRMKGYTPTRDMSPPKGYGGASMRATPPASHRSDTSKRPTPPASKR